MGNQQPKKLNKVTKIQIEVATTKSKFHLELMRDRKNAEIIKAEKQLVAKIKSKTRNKMQEILIAERIVSALKYTQACNFLMSYCASLKAQANFLAENLYNPAKLQPFLGMIYSLLYAAETMGLSSLKEFRDLLRSLNDPNSLPALCDVEIKNMLSPQPTPSEVNQYFIEMSERNDIPLEQINIIGHKFSQNIDEKPSNQPTFSQIEKKLAEQMKKNMGSNQPGQGGNFGGMGGGQGYNNHPGFNKGYNYNPNFTPMNPNFTPNNQGWGGNNQSYNNSQNFTPTNNYTPNNVIPPPGMSQPLDKTVHDSNPYGIRDTYRPNNGFGPQFYTPQKIQQRKDLPQPYMPATQSKMSIKDINDIAYFPQIDPIQPKIDPNFNALCERIRTGL